MTIRNRVREYRMVDPSEVAPNPRNWRTHPDRQRRALRAVLEQIGIAGSVADARGCETRALGGCPVAANRGATVPAQRSVSAMDGSSRVWRRRKNLRN